MIGVYGYITSDWCLKMKAKINALMLRCPMFEICRSSMARICTCEIMDAQSHRGVMVWNAGKVEGGVKRRV